MARLPGRNARSEWKGHPSYDPKRDAEFAALGNELGNMMGGMVTGVAKSKVGKIVIGLWVLGALLSIGAVAAVVLVLLAIF